MTDRILTLHPAEGKSGVNISRAKYDAIKKAIIDALRDHQEMTFSDLTENVHQKLEGSFDGSIPWYVTTVKLDLEARGDIRRIPQSNPQRLTLA